MSSVETAIAEIENVLKLVIYEIDQLPEDEDSHQASGEHQWYQAAGQSGVSSASDEV